jgi:hypothetical protein
VRCLLGEYVSLSACERLCYIESACSAFGWPTGPIMLGHAWDGEAEAESLTYGETKLKF